MKVFDCFLFSHELDLLEIRLNELSSVVTHTIVVEANLTGSKIPKPYADLSKFKVHHSKIKLDSAFEGITEETKHLPIYRQREYLKAAVDLHQPEDDDIVILSDLDEIPKAEVINEYIANKTMTPVVVRIRGYYWYCNTPINSPADHVWFHCPVILRYSDFKKYDTYYIRESLRNSSPTMTGGWHFSHVGSIKDKVFKITASTHTEFINDNYALEDKIRARSENLIDPYDRGGFSISRDNNYPLPKYIEDNKDKFQHLLWNHTKS